MARSGQEKQEKQEKQGKEEKLAALRSEIRRLEG